MCLGLRWSPRWAVDGVFISSVHLWGTAPLRAQAHFLPGTWLSSGLGILLATRVHLFYIAQSPQLPVEVTGVDTGVL